MTEFPAAFCRTCGEYLSPVGSMKAAREAKRNHGETMLTFEGTRHRMVVVESRADEVEVGVA